MGCRRRRFTTGRPSTEAWAQRYVIPVKAEDLQAWELKVEANQSAMLACGDGNWRELWANQIECTDFPEPCIRFYYANWVIHLPSEY
jgi:hypothetical protein